MSAQAIEVGLLDNAPTDTINVEADPEGHLVIGAQAAGLSVIACPGGDVRLFVPWGTLAYAMVTETTDVHEGADSAPAKLGKDVRVKHARIGLGTIASDTVDADGDWWVVFDSGATGYVAEDELTIAEPGA